MVRSSIRRFPNSLKGKNQLLANKTIFFSNRVRNFEWEKSTFLTTLIGWEIFHSNRSLLRKKNSKKWDFFEILSLGEPL